jgi:hypothetical protein
MKTAIALPFYSPIPARTAPLSRKTMPNKFVVYREPIRGLITINSQLKWAYLGFRRLDSQA